MFFHATFPAPVVLGRGAYDLSLGRVLRLGPTFAWFVMHQGLHADGYEGEHGVIMSAVDVGVR